ncbi:hypothetical protein MELA_02596 [Candidatus Methylomirabilis lanthanidiphila]|uniref:Uncharacterized protein n=1 Tax=Candidatus Methylomirabilis lanthanidiphila TaxID=2211376 RepID=A0A564ZLI2_9BACT|nr:hypothetical protein MELA_02596 [Candidatus Methylomirabilis lanthanidiphila]
MAGMAQVVMNILTTPMGALAGLVAVVALVLFARWVFSEPQK